MLYCDFERKIQTPSAIRRRTCNAPQGILLRKKERTQRSLPRKQRCALSGHTLFIGLLHASFKLAFYITTSGIKFNVKKRLPKNTLPALAVGLFMVLLVLRPSYFLDSASRGLLLFATSVLPAVFPFFFCSSLLTALGGANALSRLGAKPVRALFNSPPVGAYVLTLSMLSGYPIGAATTADLYLRGAINSDDAKRICSFTSTSGPIFILGTVGSAVFGSPVCGAVILAAHYAAAVTTGIVFRGRRKPSPPRTLPPPADHDGILAGCISSAALSMLAFGAELIAAAVRGGFDLGANAAHILMAALSALLLIVSAVLAAVANRREDEEEERAMRAASEI